MRVAVAVLNWNNGPTTTDCLESPTAGSSAVDVVGPTDDSIEVLRRSHRPAHMIPLSTNEGFRRGIATGLRSMLSQPNYDVIALLNNDALVRSAAFLSAAEILRIDPSIELLTARVIRPDGRLRYGGGCLRRFRGGVKIEGANEPDILQLDSAKNVTFPSLAFGTRREALEHIGLLAEKYFSGDEECRYSLCVAALGHGLCDDASLLRIHDGDGSHDNAAPEFIYNRYRKRLMSQQNHLPPPAFAFRPAVFRINPHTVLPTSTCLRHGASQPAKILRLCAKEAMRDHTRGRRVQYRDLVTFRARTGVPPESTTYGDRE